MSTLDLNILLLYWGIFSCYNVTVRTDSIFDKQWTVEMLGYVSYSNLLREFTGLQETAETNNVHKY
jgi:hypothetical protein